MSSSAHCCSSQNTSWWTVTSRTPWILWHYSRTPTALSHTLGCAGSLNYGGRCKYECKFWEGIYTMMLFLFLFSILHASSYFFLSQSSFAVEFLFLDKATTAWLYVPSEINKVAFHESRLVFVWFWWHSELVKGKKKNRINKNRLPLFFVPFCLCFFFTAAEIAQHRQPMQVKIMPLQLS